MPKRVKESSSDDSDDEAPKKKKVVEEEEEEVSSSAIESMARAFLHPSIESEDAMKLMRALYKSPECRDVLKEFPPKFTRSFIWNVVSEKDPNKSFCGHVIEAPNTHWDTYFFDLLDLYKGGAQKHPLGGYDLRFYKPNDAWQWARGVLKAASIEEFEHFYNEHDPQPMNFEDIPEDLVSNDPPTFPEPHASVFDWVDIETDYLEHVCHDITKFFETRPLVPPGIKDGKFKLLTAKDLDALQLMGCPVKHVAVVTAIRERWDGRSH